MTDGFFEILDRNSDWCESEILGMMYEYLELTDQEKHVEAFFQEKEAVLNRIIEEAV